ncbi:MAG: hypothetical protein AAGA47_12605 [Pseudomonadota bacterium]
MTTNSTNTFLPSSMVDKGYLSQVHWPGAHWFVRIPLALIIGNQGYLKFIDLAGGAEAYGFPIWMWALAALAEVAAAAGLIVGGVVKSLNPSNRLLALFGDVVTRLSGFATTAVVAAVIAIVYWGPWAGFQLQLMLLAGGIFFMLRGNRT